MIKDHLLKGHSPARLDWSIIGCTILLLALMNLERQENIHINKDDQRAARETSLGSIYDTQNVKIMNMTGHKQMYISGDIRR